MFRFRSSGPRVRSMSMEPQRNVRVELDTPRMFTSSRGSYTTNDGNKQTFVHTDQYTLRSPDARTVSNITEQKTITRYGSGNIGMSPAVSHTSLGSAEHKSRSPNRSPLIWQPPSQNRANIQKSQSSLDISFGHKKTSHSPVMWQPRSVSPSPGSHGRPASVQSGSLDRISVRRSSRDSRASKENLDPIILREQKKWEATHVSELSYDSYNIRKAAGMKYAPPKMDDPNYPMFELPKKVEWTPPKINVHPDPIGSPVKKKGPPVPAKPMSPSSPHIYFDPTEQAVAGVSSHHPGMIRPPAQPNLMPAPPPPPLPPSPSENPRFNVVSIQAKLDSSRQGEDEPDTAKRPGHLHVFQPKVMFTPDEENELASPDYPEGHSDISSHRSKLPWQWSYLIMHVVFSQYICMVIEVKPSTYDDDDKRAVTLANYVKFRPDSPYQFIKFRPFDIENIII